LIGIVLREELYLGKYIIWQNAKMSKKHRKSNKSIENAIKPAGNSAEIVSVTDVKTFLLANLDSIIVLIFLSLGIYINSLNGVFVSDDIAGIVTNPMTKDFTASVKTLQLQKIIHSAIFLTFGMNQIPFHISSLSIHILNVILAYIFATQLFGKKIAFLSTLLFAAHPVNVEAVSWISGSLYLINGFGGLTTLILYTLYKKTNRTKYYWLSFILYLFLIVLLQNVWAFTIPTLIAVLEAAIFQKRPVLKNFLLLSLFILPSLGLFLYLKRSVVSVITTIGLVTTSAPFLTRLPYTFASSLKLLVFPKDLTLYHEELAISYNTYLAMTAVLLLFVILLLILWKKNRTLFGLVFFIPVSILPALSPIQIAWLVAERYLYFASFVFVILVVLLFTYIEKKTNVKNAAAILTAVLLLIYAAKTVIRNTDWRTEKSLWEATEKVSPQSPKVHNNLGDIYGREGDWERSVAQFKRAIDLDPNYADAWHNLGNTYLQLGYLDLAETHLKKSFELNPNLYQALFKLGAIEYQKKNYAKATEYMTEVLKINPKLEDAKKALQIIADTAR